MPKSKQCMYSLCQNTTYSSKPRTVATKFIPFPRPRKVPDKCMQWISACGRFDDRLNIEKLAKKSYYICEEHFVGGKGPTAENPNPIPFKETTETLNLMNQSWSSSRSFSLQDNALEPILDIYEILPDTSLVFANLHIESQESDHWAIGVESSFRRKARLIQGAIPTIFTYQNETETKPPRSLIAKRQRKQTMEEISMDIIEDVSTFDSTLNSVFVQTINKVVDAYTNTDQQLQSKKVQTDRLIKHFRSKSTQTVQQKRVENKLPLSDEVFNK